MLLLVIVLLVLALAFPFSYGRDLGYYRWSPLGVILIIIVVLALTGHLGRW